MRLVLLIALSTLVSGKFVLAEAPVSTLWHAYTSAGETAMDSREFEKAAECFKLALDETNSETNPHVRIVTLWHFGSALSHLNRIEQATSVYEESLNALDSLNPKDTPDVAHNLIELARLYHAAKAEIKAEAVHDYAVHLLTTECDGKDPRVVHSIIDVAWFELQTHDYSSALSLGHHGLSLIENIESLSFRDAADCHDVLADAYLGLGKLSDALAHAKKAIELIDFAIAKGEVQKKHNENDIARMKKRIEQLTESDVNQTPPSGSKQD